MSRRYVVRGVSKWNAGSGTFQPGSVRRLEQLLGPRGRRQRAAGERAGAEREDPLLLERRADLAHQVELPVEEVAAEHVEPAHAAVGLDHVDLERRRAVAVDGVAPLAQVRCSRKDSRITSSGCVCRLT